jgi:hypothetical protein
VLPGAAGLPTVRTAVDPRALAVEISIDTLAAAVETLINAIAFAVELRCEAVAIICLGTLGAAIETVVDVIALAIEACLHAITAIVEAVLDAVARIGQRAARNQQKSGGAHDECSRIHDGLPGVLANVVCSGITTQHGWMR